MAGYPTNEALLAAQMAGMNLPPAGQPAAPTASAPLGPQQYPPQVYQQQTFQQQGYAPQQQQQQYPPPQQGYAPQQYPPPQGYAPQGSPQQVHQQQGYPAPQGYVAPGGLPPPQGVAPPPPAPAQVVLTIPATSLPAGFSVMDAFRQNNVIQLVSRSNGDLVSVKQGNLRANGDFMKADSQWSVIIETNGTCVLQNMQWPGCHLAIKSKGKELTTKKVDKQCQFRVKVLPDNYITLESVEFPGSYVGFSSNGNPSNPKELGPVVADAQFFVRVLRQKHPFSNPILTAYQRPSVFASLSDRSVVQLYTKASNNYMAISGVGNIFSTVNGNDPNTFFIWMDHGMGIVSLQSKKYEGYRFRMCNFQVTPKGEPDLNGDFRVMENADGTIKLESVTCGGAFLGIPSGATPTTNISLYLVTIQKFGKSETITKAPIN